MMFRSIRSRLSLSFAGIALIAAIVLGVALLAILQNYYLNQEIKYLQGNAQSIGNVVRIMLSNKAPQAEIQSQIENLAFLSQTRVQVYDPDEQLLYDSGSPQNLDVNLGVMDQLPAGADGSLRTLRIISIESNQEVITTLSGTATPSDPTQDDKFLMIYRTIQVGGSPFGFDLNSETASNNPRSELIIAELIRDPKNENELGSVRLSEGPDYGSDILRSVARGWVLASAIALVLAAGIGWYISRRISAPIVALTDVTGRMAHGDLSGRANVESRDELGHLGRSFNEMAAQVEMTVTTLRRFVADAAHELRTPLTVLRTNLDLMLDEKDAASRAAFVADARAMVKRLEELNTNLLDLSRLEAYHRGASDSIIDLTALLQARSEVYASQAEQAGLVFEQDLPSESILIRAAESEIMRAMDNLVDNACKFTPQDGTVRVALTQQAGQAMVSVADTGIGIPQDDLPQLFHRFHRGRNTTAYPGSGLGLAIARAIVTAYGGQIDVQSGGEGRGSKFSIRLPVVFPQEL